MDDKLINMIVKGIPPHEFVEWYKLVQEKTERDKGWFDQHAVLFNPSIDTPIPTGTTEEDIYFVLQKLKSTFESTIDKYSTIIERLENSKNQLEGFTNQVDGLLKSLEENTNE